MASINTDANRLIFYPTTYTRARNAKRKRPAMCIIATMLISMNSNTDLCLIRDFVTLAWLCKMTLTNSFRNGDFRSIRQSDLFMRTIQLREEEISAKGGSASQWHYFSKKWPVASVR